MYPQGQNYPWLRTTHSQIAHQWSLTSQKKKPDFIYWENISPPTKQCLSPASSENKSKSNQTSRPNFRIHQNKKRSTTPQGCKQQNLFYRESLQDKASLFNKNLREKNRKGIYRLRDSQNVSSNKQYVDFILIAIQTNCKKIFKWHLWDKFESAWTVWY